MPDIIHMKLWPAKIVGELPKDETRSYIILK